MNRRIAALICALILAGCAQATSVSSALRDAESTTDDRLVVDGNAIFTGTVSAQKLVGENLNVLGSTNVNGDAIADVVRFVSADITTIKVNKVVAKGSLLDIKGNLVIKPFHQNAEQTNGTSTATETSFIEKESSSWYMHEIETFDNDEEQTQGWDSDVFNECASEHILKNRFLGGHCALSYHEVSKIYDNLPEHKHIKVHAKFHLFDNWQGEMVYIKADDHIVWSKNATTQNDDHHINICGGEGADPHYNLHAEFVLPHKVNQLKLTFGSTLERDPCQVSYAVDDVVLYIK